MRVQKRLQASAANSEVSFSFQAVSCKPTVQPQRMPYGLRHVQVCAIISAQN